MDFFSREVKDSFDEMFDLNHDGKLDAGEQALQFEVMEEEMKSDYSFDNDMT